MTGQDSTPPTTTALTSNLAALCNEFTARWCDSAARDAASFVLSGPSAWPLLALLTSVATEPVRAELTAATGLTSQPTGLTSRPTDPPADDLAAAVELVELLDSADATTAALGIWVRAQAPLRPDFTARLPAGTVGPLTGDRAADQRTLDDWAARHTDGLIPRMPISIGPDDLLLLASALAARTVWQTPFIERAGVLRRSSRDLDEAGVIDAGGHEVTRLVVAGDNGLDVHLVQSADGRSAQTLAAALAAHAATADVTPASALQAGASAPGLTVTRMTTTNPNDMLRVETPPFEVRCEHDLARTPDVFGLATAMRPGPLGHFPGLSDVPLLVSQARSSVVAKFSATGFEAAAITAVAMMAASARARDDTFTTREIRVRFTPPFGFLAVHRASGLVIAAGWVADG